MGLAEDSRTSAPVVVAKHRELSDLELERLEHREVVAAYRALRDHHVAETTALRARAQTNVTRVASVPSSPVPPVASNAHGRAASHAVTSSRVIRPPAVFKLDPSKIVPADEILPWKVTELVDPNGASLRPYPDLWSFNPSIHFDGETWRCVLRCCDYAMPDGAQVRPPGAQQGYTQTRNALVTLDPKTWRPRTIHRVRELDGLPRATPCAHKGFEDLRIFHTELGGLQAIAASLQLRDGPRRPEQVLLTFNAEGDISAAKPIRGTWGGRPQKNWVPFDGCAEPRFLYSIDEGVVFGDRGPVSSWTDPDAKKGHGKKKAIQGGTDVIVRRRTIAVNAGAAGRIEYGGLRGGSQLVHLGDGTWLGIGHEMIFVEQKKFYWHVWYTVDSSGALVAKSPPMKIASEWIEFAAGMAIDGDRVVVSFGVDDMLCRIGETELAAVLGALQPVEVSG